MQNLEAEAGATPTAGHDEIAEMTERARRLANEGRERAANRSRLQTKSREELVDICKAAMVATSQMAERLASVLDALNGQAALAQSAKQRAEAAEARAREAEARLEAAQADLAAMRQDVIQAVNAVMGAEGMGGELEALAWPWPTDAGEAALFAEDLEVASYADAADALTRVRRRVQDGAALYWQAVDLGDGEDPATALGDAVVATGSWATPLALFDDHPVCGWVATDRPLSAAERQRLGLIADDARAANRGRNPA